MNWSRAISLTRVRERIAFWIAPRLPKILKRSLDTIELQEARQAQSLPDDLDLRVEILGELQEAATLSGGAAWMGGEPTYGPAATQLLRAADEIKAEAHRESKAVALKETIYGMAELELALEDRGWKRLIAQSHYEFSRFGIQSIMLICRLHWVKNPLARRGVDVSAFYVFGRGMEISSPDEDANEVLQDFFGDPRNKDQFAHSACVRSERKTYTDGNVFWALFTDPKDGMVIVRGLDALEMEDIICNPEDQSQPWFYKRRWAKETFDRATGNRIWTQQVAWYFAIGYEEIPNFPVGIREIERDPVAVDAAGQPIPVLHLKEGELPGSRFGIPRMYPAVDWLRAYRHVLEDLCTVWRALSRFAWNVETKGGAPAIAAIKQTLATTLMNDLQQIETNPPPVTGSAWISSGSNKITPMQAGGNTTMNPDNARRVLLMVCAAFGIGEHLMGDATTGSLATAASLERPTELMFLERQEVWREIYQMLGFYALKRSTKAPKGKLREAYARRQGVDPSEFRPESVEFAMPTPGIRFREGRKERAVSRVSQSNGEGAESKSEIQIGSNPGALPVTEAGIDNLGKYAHPPGGKKSLAKKKQAKVTIDVKFPDILAHEIKDRVAAITQALTLNNTSGQVVGIDERTGMGLLLAELGVEDVNAVLEAMYPEDDYEANRLIEEEPPAPTPGVPPPAPGAPPAAQPPQAGAVPPAEPPKAAEPPPKPTAKPSKGKESVSGDPEVIERAVQQLIEAARKRLEAERARMRAA